MRKIITVLCLSLMLVSLVGCSNARLDAMYDDDTALAASGDSYSAVMSSSTTLGSTFSQTATMTGTETIWRYNARENIEVTFSYSLSVSEGGSAKLVLITPDDKVIILIEDANNTGSTEMQSQTIQLAEGNNRIKIVGQGAPRYELRLNVGVGQLGGE